MRSRTYYDKLNETVCLAGVSIAHPCSCPAFRSLTSSGKAKVLASLLKNDEFKRWVDAELKGLRY